MTRKVVREVKALSIGMTAKEEQKAKKKEMLQAQKARAPLPPGHPSDSATVPASAERLPD